MAEHDDNFFDDLTLGGFSLTSTSLDDHLQGRNQGNGYFQQVRGLSDRGRDEQGLQLPVDAGVRVAFNANIGSVLATDYVPDEGVEGTVIMVRTAEGDATSTGDEVFVKWDDGHFGRVHRHHLRRAMRNRQAAQFGFRAANFDFASFFTQAGTKNSELIHKSTKDLWTVEERDGQFVVSRLFDDTGEPLKG